MRRAGLFSWVIVACLIHGCAIMRPHGSEHPGITDLNPNAVTRVFPATATRVAQTMADVMANDSILDHVAMVPDTGSKEYRPFSRADRQALGISLLTPANDVNYNITAKSKDGHPVAVAVRLKDASSAEVSVLYGFSGDPGLSRSLLDDVEAALSVPAKDPNVAKTSGAKAASRKATTR